MAPPYGRYSSILMSVLLSLHPIKSFERQRPESVPHVTSRQRDREREIVSVSERQKQKEQARMRRLPGTESRHRHCQEDKAYLITGSACWENAWSTTRTEGQKQPGGSQDMISKIIKAKDRKRKTP